MLLPVNLCILVVMLSDQLMYPGGKEYDEAPGE